MRLRGSRSGPRGWWLLGAEEKSEESSHDARLIEGLEKRDEASLRALVDAYGDHVYARALHILREPQLAEEVARDTLLLLWWEPHRFDIAKATLRAFLMGVARFKAIDVIPRDLPAVAAGWRNDGSRVGPSRQARGLRLWKSHKPGGFSTR